MPKVSDFSSQRAGRPSLEQRWMESLAGSLQARNFEPQFSAISTGPVTAVPSGSDFYVYLALNALIMVQFSRAISLSGIVSQQISITLPAPPRGDIKFAGYIYTAGVEHPCIVESVAGTTSLGFRREDSISHPLGNHTLNGTFLYFRTAAAG